MLRSQALRIGGEFSIGELDVVDVTNYAVTQGGGTCNANDRPNNEFTIPAAAQPGDLMFVVELSLLDGPTAGSWSYADPTGGFENIAYAYINNSDYGVVGCDTDAMNALSYKVLTQDDMGETYTVSSSNYGRYRYATITVRGSKPISQVIIWDTTTQYNFNNQTPHSGTPPTEGVYLEFYTSRGIRPLPNCADGPIIDQAPEGVYVIDGSDFSIIGEFGGAYAFRIANTGGGSVTYRTGNMDCPENYYGANYYYTTTLSFLQVR